MEVVAGDVFLVQRQLFAARVEIDQVDPTGKKRGRALHDHIPAGDLGGKLLGIFFLVERYQRQVRYVADKNPCVGIVDEDRQQLCEVVLVAAEKYARVQVVHHVPDGDDRRMRGDGRRQLAGERSLEQSAADAQVHEPHPGRHLAVQDVDPALALRVVGAHLGQQRAPNAQSSVRRGTAGRAPGSGCSRLGKSRSLQRGECNVFLHPVRQQVRLSLLSDT